MDTKTELAGKLALVTGSSRGIGRVVALYLAQRGCDVIVHYRREAAAAELVATKIRQLGRVSDVIRADLTSEDDVLSLMGTIRERHGYLDILVANAASTAFKTIDETKPHHIDLTFAIVIKSFLLMVQHAAELMTDRHGSIVTISGLDTTRFVPRHSTLGAAKAALETLTRYVACEYFPRGISVNCVAPGPTLTDSLAVIARSRNSDEYIAALQNRARMTAGGRLTRPEDIAPIVAFLCTEGSRWIVGQTITVDGGFALGFDPYTDRPIESITLNPARRCSCRRRVTILRPRPECYKHSVFRRGDVHSSWGWSSVMTGRYGPCTVHFYTSTYSAMRRERAECCGRQGDELGNAC